MSSDLDRGPARPLAAGELSLFTDPTAATARETVVGHARRAGLPAGGQRDLELAVSELVTNARRHGRAPVTLTVDARPGALWVEVSDRGPGPACHVDACAEPGATATSGRGRWILRNLDVEVEEVWTATGYSIRVGVLRSVTGRRPTTS